MSKKIKGYLLVFLAVTFWGISGPVAKYLFLRAFDPFLVIQTRSTFSFIFLFLILFLAKPGLLKINLCDLKYYVILGIFGLAGSNFFYYSAISYITVCTAIMLQYTTPFIVLIFSIATKQEKFHWLKILLLLTAFISLFFAVSGGNSSYFSINVIGVLFGIASALTWSFYNVYNKKLNRRYNDWTELVYILGSASLLWLIINPMIIVQVTNFYPKDIVILVGFAFISVMIPMFLYNIGLKLLRATQATTIGLLEPVVVVFAAFLILRENITFVQMLSSTIVLLSIFLLENVRKKTDSSVKE